jgi:hypothetical protein
MKILENQPFLPRGEPFAAIFISWMGFPKARHDLSRCSGSDNQTDFSRFSFGFGQLWIARHAKF